MNAVLTNIFSRRSVREFSNQKIAESDLELIVKAGIHAPSGMNRQTWNFCILTNQEKIQELAHLVELKLNRPDYNFYKPAALIIPSNDRENPLGQDDNACALENIFLAAHSLGIGSVWINQLRTICDDTEIRSFLNAIQIPETHVVYGAVALGYPLKVLEDKPRKQSFYFIR